MNPESTKYKIVNLRAKELKKQAFLVKNIKQFKPVDVRKIPATIGPGGMMSFNARDKNGNLHETVWDIFAQPMSQQITTVQRQIAVPVHQFHQHNVGAVVQPTTQYNYMMPQMVQQLY